MKRLARIAFIVFWAIVAAYLVRGLHSPAPVPAASDGSGAAGNARVIQEQELAGHARAQDCWIAVRGGVYDISAYLPSHPAGEDIILPWCGRDATRAFTDLGKGATHSPRAWRLLERYRVGTYQAAVSPAP